MSDSRSDTLSLPVDVAVIGGGISGLWLANRLHRAGYSCVLLEARELGEVQTLHSQGIIHGGLKYALGGALSSESEAIAGMPDRWRQLLAGEGEVDLRGVSVLSQTQHLWSAGSLASRFTTFFASRMLRGRIDKLAFADYPVALQDRRFRGAVYRLDDLVVDTDSLVSTLAAPIQPHCLQVQVSADQLHWHEQGLAAITLPGVTLQPRRAILAAGAGNAALLDDARRAGLSPLPDTQLRPLQMVMVAHAQPLPLYAHCIGASNKPRLTITSHPLPDGRMVWYLGGDLAERGVGLSAEALLADARQELATLFPWLDFSTADWATTAVERAEPRQGSLAKPDNAFAEAQQNLIVAWPTKLTLAPDLGDRVAALLSAQGFVPQHPQPTLPDDLPRAHPGRAPWMTAFGDRHD